MLEESTSKGTSLAASIKKVPSSIIRLPWSSLFVSNDAFSWPFQRQFQRGRLFFPTYGMTLTAVQFECLAEAAKEIGDESFFISLVEAEGFDFLEDNSRHWKCVTPIFDDYDQLNLNLENTIYSTQGKWGVLISHESHALVSGTEEFLHALDGAYQNWEVDWNALNLHWKGNVNSGWIVNLRKNLEPACGH